MLGNAIIDEFIRVPHLARRGGDVLAEGAESYVGGCGANVAVTLARLGVPVTLLGRVGDDPRGQRIRAYLQDEGVETDNLTLLPGHTTGYCLTFVEPDGERTFVTVPGCESLPPDPAGVSQLRSWSALYVSGYSLISPDAAAATLEVMRAARERGIVVVFDPGPLARSGAPDSLSVALQASTAVLASEGEIDQVSGAAAREGPEVVAIKSGRKGARIYTPGGKPLVIPALEIAAVDTTGAGDAFAAGLIYGLINSWPLKRSARFAAACGAAATMVRGPVGVRDLDQIATLVARLSCSPAPPGCRRRSARPRPPGSGPPGRRRRDGAGGV